MKKKINQFENLEIWQLARKLTNEIYRISENSNMIKDFNLKNQMQRSAVSIMSNIAEGFERKSTKEFIHFLFTAKGSCGELRSQLYIALDLKYIENNEFDNIYNLAVQISKSLAGFIKYLQSLSLKSSNRESGFTILELMMVVFALSIIVGVVTISYRSFISWKKVEKEAEVFANTIRRYQNEAAATNNLYALYVSQREYAVLNYPGKSINEINSRLDQTGAIIMEKRTFSSGIKLTYFMAEDGETVKTFNIENLSKTIPGNEIIEANTVFHTDGRLDNCEFVFASEADNAKVLVSNSIVSVNKMRTAVNWADINVAFENSIESSLAAGQNYIVYNSELFDVRGWHYIRIESPENYETIKLKIKTCYDMPESCHFHVCVFPEKNTDVKIARGFTNNNIYGNNHPPNAFLQDWRDEAINASNAQNVQISNFTGEGTAKEFYLYADTFTVSAINPPYKVYDDRGMKSLAVTLMGDYTHPEALEFVWGEVPANVINPGSLVGDFAKPGNNWNVVTAPEGGWAQSIFAGQVNHSSHDGMEIKPGEWSYAFDIKPYISGADYVLIAIAAYHNKNGVDNVFNIFSNSKDNYEYASTVSSNSIDYPNDPFILWYPWTRSYSADPIWLSHYGYVMKPLVRPSMIDLISSVGAKYDKVSDFDAEFQYSFPGHPCLSYQQVLYNWNDMIGEDAIKWVLAWTTNTFELNQWYKKAEFKRGCNVDFGFTDDIDLPRWVRTMIDGDIYYWGSVWSVFNMLDSHTFIFGWCNYLYNILFQHLVYYNNPYVNPDLNERPKRFTWPLMRGISGKTEWMELFSYTPPEGDYEKIQKEYGFSFNEADTSIYQGTNLAQPLLLSGQSAYFLYKPTVPPMFGQLKILNSSDVLSAYFCSYLYVWAIEMESILNVPLPPQYFEFQPDAKSLGLEIAKQSPSFVNNAYCYLKDYYLNIPSNKYWFDFNYVNPKYGDLTDLVANAIQNCNYSALLQNPPTSRSFLQPTIKYYFNSAYYSIDKIQVWAKKKQ